MTLHMTIIPPHISELNLLSPDKAILAAELDNKGMHIYAVSRDFYNAENYDLGVEIYPAYEQLFHTIKEQLTIHLQSAPVELTHDDATFCEWSSGDRIAIWTSHNLCLSIHYEDRECPIYIMLQKHASIPFDIP